MFNFIKSQIKKSQEKKEEEKRIQEEEKRIQEEEKRIQEEKIRIKKEEENRLREEEKRIKKEEENRVLDEIKSTIKGDLLTMCHIGVGILTSESINIGLINAVDIFDNKKMKIDNNIISKNIINMYKMIRNINTINNFDKILDEDKLSSIASEIIVHGMGIKMNSNDKYYLKQSVSIFMENEIENIIINDAILEQNQIVDFVGRQITEYMEEKINSIKSLIDDTITTFNPKQEAIKMIVLLIIYAKAFNKMILIERYYKCKFVKNIELYNISQNLFIELEDGDLVIEKLYPIYERFYSNIFDDKVSKENLNIIWKMAQIKENYEESSVEQTFKGIVDELSFDLSNKDNLDKMEIIIKRIIDVNTGFFDNKYAILICMYLVIKDVIDEIDFNELMNIFCSRNILQNKANEYKDTLILEREREKYLNGDFSDEKMLKLDIEKFNSINTGAEFEIYLKDLYSKLGYEVQTTKTTGDQGADLIMTKNSKKTVVQSKFYSTSVGNKAVQEVVGAIKFYKADYGMVITNNTFTKSAIDLANSNNIELIDGLKLNELREKIYLKE